MFTNKMRMTGFSGFDSEALVRQLMQAESVRYNNLLRRNTFTQWKQEAIRSVANDIRSFQTNVLNVSGKDSIRFPSNFRATSGAVTRANGDAANEVRVTTGANTRLGTYDVKIQQMAQRERHQGAKDSITITSKLTGDGIDFNSIKPGEGFSFNISVNGGASRTIQFTADEAAELHALRDDPAEANQRLLEMLNGNAEADIPSKLAAAGIENVTASITNNRLELTSANGSPLRITGTEGSAGALGISTNQASIVNTDMKLSDLGIVGSGVFTINNKEITFNASDSVSDLMKKISEHGATLQFNQQTKSFTLQGNQVGANGALNLGGEDRDVIMGALGFHTGPGAPPPGGPTFQAAQDTVAFINDERVTSSNNVLNHQGMSITLGVGVNATTNSEFQIEVTSDTTQLKNMITNFVDEYNKLVKTLNDLQRTPRPKSVTGEFFEPLTDEEKRGMTETEIQKWEEKAREGVLHRDPILEKLQRDMRMALMNPVEIRDADGNVTRISLSMLGITTTNNHADGGILEINEEKLDQMLRERPDDVRALFTQSGDGAAKGLGDRLNDIVHGAVSSGGTLTRLAGSEAHTASEKTNRMYREISEQNNRLAQMLDVLRKKEDYYFSMFAKMEAAMMKADSQMASIMGMFGQGMM